MGVMFHLHSVCIKPANAPKVMKIKREFASFFFLVYYYLGVLCFVDRVMVKLMGRML